MSKNEVGVLRERVNQMLDDLNRSFERDDEDLKGGWESETQRKTSNKFLSFLVWIYFYEQIYALKKQKNNFK